jgi:FkbM family methyltransferase
MAETLRAKLRRAANAALEPFGLHLLRADRAFTMDGLLARAAARGSHPGTWFDIGASDGSWSLRAQRYFPKACFVLFEPLAERQPVLEDLRARHGFDLVAAVAGARSGSVEFSVDDDLDGSGVAQEGAKHTRKVPVVTIDEIVQSRALPGPFALKLDTHGYEREVLTGAERTLAKTQLLVIEAYAFTLRPGSMQFHELCAWLGDRGFRCCDLADPMRRADGALWQMDLAFAPANSPLFASNDFAQ